MADKLSELYQTDCEQILSHLKHHQKLLILKRRWLMGLPISESQEKKIFKYRSLPESLLREDDIFYETVKSYVEETFGSQNAEREDHTIHDTEQMSERTNLKRILLSQLDALSTKGLYRIAMLLTKGSVKFEKTRCKMKTVIKETVPEVFRIQNDDHGQIELLRKLSELVHDPQHVRENCLKLFIPTFQSHRDIAIRVLEELEDLSSETLLAMRRKLRSVPASIPNLGQNRQGRSRAKLIHDVRTISEKMLSELGAGDELQAPLAKALAIAGLSLKVTLGFTSSSVPDFNQFSPEIKSLQNEIAKAIWILNVTTTVRVKQLKKLQHLLDPSANISNSSLRTALKKLLTQYLFECSDLDTIPKSLSEAISIINNSSRSSLSGIFLKEDIEEEVECVLNVSAQTRQIVWDLFPQHEFDEDYSDAYMEELEESDDGDNDDEDDDNDDENVIAASPISDYYNDRKFEVGNFYSRSHSIGLNHQEESTGDNILVDSTLPISTPKQSCGPSRLQELRDHNNNINFFESQKAGKFGPSSRKRNSFSPPLSPTESLNGSFKANEPEHDSAMDSDSPLDLPTSDFRFEGERLVPDKASTHKNLYLGIQEACDETSIVAYNLIGNAMEGFAQEEGLDLDWIDRSYLRSDYSSQESQEEKPRFSTGSVIIQVVEDLVPTIPKRVVNKLKQLMGI